MDDHKRLEALLADSRALRARLESRLPREMLSKGIRTGFGLALRFGGQDVFSMKPGEADAAAFNAICRAVRDLPRDQSDFVAESLGLVGTGPRMVDRWTSRTPHPYVMPEALKAFELSVSMILGENAADREMRVFHLVIGRFHHAAYKASSGSAWTSVERPAVPVPKYDAEAFALRDETLERFARIERRHIRLMDDRLRRYRPLKFDPGLAPPGQVNSNEDQEKLLRLNDLAEETARGFSTGAVTVRDVVASLKTTDTERLMTLAGYLLHASELYFEAGTVLATVETDDAGNVSSMDVPEPDGMTMQ